MNDHPELRNMVGDDDPALIAEVLALYVTESTRLLNELRTHFEAGTIPGMIRTAHTLKPSSAIVGAHEIAGLCQKIEHLGRATDLDALSIVLAELEVEHARFVALLTAER